MGRTVYYDLNGNEIDPPKSDVIKQTNADLIRAMKDEELAESLGILTDCRECSHRNADDSCNIVDGSCQTQWLEWLKQEVKE